jgi:hypothetical protein
MARKKNSYKIEGLRDSRKGTFPWVAVCLAMVVVVLLGVILSPIPEKIRRRLGLSERPTVREVIREAPAPEPEVIYEDRVVEKKIKVPPPYYRVERGTDVSKTSRGFDYKRKVEERGGGLASGEREKDGSYEASLLLAVNRPQAAKRFEELVTMNSALPEILPDLEMMVEKAVISPFYKKLYDNKAERLKKYADRFDRVLTKHNYYDCQTMLELEHPGSGRRVFLMQADMDVVSDGSDGDRLPIMPEDIVNSAYYQPFTSYGWKKTGTTENPMIAGWRKRLRKAREAGETDEVKRLERGIADLQRRSFLIAEYDPFIVIPVDILGDRESAWGPNVGDYVAVVHGKKIYPAIVGDGGPTFKVGEASLRMAKEINSRASPYSRPVSDLKVTYLVFPRSSAKEWKAPDYADWRSECARLLEEIGGLGEGYQLHQWKNTLPELEVAPELEEAAPE